MGDQTPDGDNTSRTVGRFFIGLALGIVFLIGGTAIIGSFANRGNPGNGAATALIVLLMLQLGLALAALTRPSTRPLGCGIASVLLILPVIVAVACGA